MTEMMNISQKAPIFHPTNVQRSLSKSGWTLKTVRRSFSTGGSYEVWTHTHENTNETGYASVPVGDEYIPRFAQETLTSVADHHKLSQEYVYHKLFNGEQI